MVRNNVKFSNFDFNKLSLGAKDDYGYYYLESEGGKPEI